MCCPDMSNHALAVRFLALASCAVLLAFGSVTPASGQETGQWEEIKAAVQAGDSVVILAQDGRRFRASVVKVGNTALNVRTSDIDQVLSIEHLRELSVRRNDRLWNGLLIGAAMGALGGLVPDYMDDCKECHDSLYGSIAAGAGAGLLIDALVRQQKLIYRAPESAVKMSFGIQTRGSRTTVVLAVRF